MEQETLAVPHDTSSRPSKYQGNHHLGEWRLHPKVVRGYWTNMARQMWICLLWSEWEAMDSGDSSTAVFRSVVPSSGQRLSLPSMREDFSFTSTEVESQGLACERSNLNALGFLPSRVLECNPPENLRHGVRKDKIYHSFPQYLAFLPSFRRY